VSSLRLSSLVCGGFPGVELRGLEPRCLRYYTYSSTGIDLTGQRTAALRHCGTAALLPSRLFDRAHDGGTPWDSLLDEYCLPGLFPKESGHLGIPINAICVICFFVLIKRQARTSPCKASFQTQVDACQPRHSSGT